jgi:hypothetical protein
MIDDQHSAVGLASRSSDLFQCTSSSIFGVQPPWGQVDMGEFKESGGTFTTM